MCIGVCVCMDVCACVLACVCVCMDVCACVLASVCVLLRFSLEQFSARAVKKAGAMEKCLCSA